MDGGAGRASRNYLAQLLLTICFITGEPRGFNKLLYPQFQRQCTIHCLCQRPRISVFDTIFFLSIYSNPCCIP